MSSENATSSRKSAIILAAGKGKRMMSDLPKVLHEIHGRPMIAILLDTLIPIGFDRIVVVIGHNGEMVREKLATYPVQFVWQKEQLGTGHAVLMAKEKMTDFDGTTMVVAGDVPFLSKSSIGRLFTVHQQTHAAATCLSAIYPDPKGYGRIIREGTTDRLLEIVEERDANDDQKKINEGNSGTFCFDNRKLFSVIQQIGNSNAQREYYLTDAIKLLRNNGLVVSVVTADNPDEVEGVNSVEELEELARKFSDRC